MLKLTVVRRLSHATALISTTVARHGTARQVSCRGLSSRRISSSTLSNKFRYLILAMPVTAFALGTWQVYRRQWKLNLIDETSQKLGRDPLNSMNEISAATQSGSDAGDALPAHLVGKFDHQYEMLVGPRQRDGRTGYHVIVPFCSHDGIRILVNRGWIAKQKADQATRPAGVKNGTTSIFGLIRRQTSHNMFTPLNDYTKGQYYFVDIVEMSRRAATEPILIEVTSDSLYSMDDWEELGIPIGKPKEILLRNNHMQYIVTWYSLALATGLMSVSLFKKARIRPDIRR